MGQVPCQSDQVCAWETDEKEAKDEADDGAAVVVEVGVT